MLVLGLLDNDWHLLMDQSVMSHVLPFVTVFLTSPLSVLMNTLHAVKCVALKGSLCVLINS